MKTDKNSSSKNWRHFYHCSASHSSHSIWLTWRNLHVYAHGTCKRKMECWNPGISLDFYIQANLLLFKAPTSQPRMIIFRMLSLGNWTAIVTSFHRNREYLRRRRSLGKREDFTFLHILKIFYLYILLQIYPEDLLPLISDGSEPNNSQSWPLKRNWSWMIHERFYLEKTSILMSWSRNRRLRNWIKYYLEQ